MTENDDGIECPICGYIHSDTDERDRELWSGAMHCSQCSEPFFFKADFTITWVTRPLVEGNNYHV